MSNTKIQPFNGTGDVNVFLEKISLLAALKDYDDPKHSQLIASHLNSPAFEVYMRLSADDKKDPAKVAAELRKDFDRAVVNREEALHMRRE